MNKEELSKEQKKMWEILKYGPVNDLTYFQKQLLKGLSKFQGKPTASTGPK